MLHQSRHVHVQLNFYCYCYCFSPEQIHVILTTHALLMHVSQMCWRVRPYKLTCAWCVLCCCLCFGPLPTSVLVGTVATVTCTLTSGSWPASFNATLTATQSTGSTPDCTPLVRTATATVDIITKPTITVGPQTTSPVCSDAVNKVLTFGLSGLAANGTYTIASVTATGDVSCTPGAVTPGALMQVVRHGPLRLGGWASDSSPPILWGPHAIAFPSLASHTERLAYARVMAAT